MSTLYEDLMEGFQEIVEAQKTGKGMNSGEKRKQNGVQKNIQSASETLSVALEAKKEKRYVVEVEQLT